MEPAEGGTIDVTSQMVGADLAEMEQLARAFDVAASRLSGLAGQVRQGIQISAWLGPAAARFRVDWDSQHSRVLRHTAEELRGAARQVRAQAEDQRRASTAGSENALTPVGGRSGGGSGGWGPSDEDMAGFARAGYPDGQPPRGWRDLSKAEIARLTGGVPLHDPRSGFDARIFTDGHGHYIISFTGTDPGVNPFDGLNIDELHDVAGAGWFSSQTDQAVRLAVALQLSVGAGNLVLTGHSLGGRNAAAAAVATGSHAVTFDAAGLSDADLFAATAVRSGQPPDGGRLLGTVIQTLDIINNPHRWAWPTPSFADPERQQAAAYVTNYANFTSPLHLLQVGTALPDPIGRQVDVIDPMNTPFSFSTHDVDSIQRGMELRLDWHADMSLSLDPSAPGRMEDE